MDAIVEAIGREWMISMIAAVFIVGILGSTIREIVRVRSQERTRREIAAYIAEGSMTPEQGERLMKAKAPASNPDA